MLRSANFAGLLLLAGTMLAQGSPGASAAGKKPDSAADQVAPDDMVLVITGACETAPGDFAVRDCIRGVTREEFEALLQSFRSNPTPQSKIKTAEELGQIIIVSNEAKKENLPKDPEVKELLRVTQMQVLAQQFLARTAKDIQGKITDADIQAYYDAHIDDYKTDDLQQILIPTKLPDDDAKYAEALRARWIAGEDPVKLQAEASQRASQTNLPPFDLKGLTPSALPEPARSVFGLKPGDISEPIKDGNQLILYKVVASTTQPLKEVHTSIAQTLQRERAAETINALKQTNVIHLNGKYFNSEPAAKPDSPK